MAAKRTWEAGYLGYFEATIRFHSPFKAITLLAGFMIAESALMGRLMGLAVSFRSMITTWLALFTFSRTQMNLSDSIVSVLNEIEFALIPAAVSYE